MAIFHFFTVEVNDLAHVPLKVLRVARAAQFGLSGSAANAGAQTFSQGGGGFPGFGGGLSGSAASAGSQSFTQGGFGGGISGSSANAASQSFTQGGGFPGHFGPGFGGGLSGSAANAGAQTFSG